MKQQYLLSLAVLLIIAAFVLPVQAETAVMPGSGTGYYRCHCNVDGATVYIDGVPKGEIKDGIYTFEVHTTATPVQTIMVTREEYTHDTITGPQVPAVGETINLYFHIYPLTPATGSIYVRSDPENADVIINDNYYGKTPQNIRDLKPGAYSVEVSKTGYKTWTQTVTIEAGDEKDILATLQPWENYGSIRVTSNPSSTSVYLNGVYYGKTPITIPRLEPGSHDIELQKPGYLEQSHEIFIYAGDEQQIFYSLQPDPAPTTGQIDVTTTPGNVEIYLDDRYEGLTGADGILVIPNIPAGSHTVRATLYGNPDQQSTVTVNSGGQTPVTFTMEAPKPTGEVSAESTPAGASVYIDNQYKGITPITVSSLDPGSYSVTLRLAGYQDFSTTAMVAADSTSTVKADLVPVTTQPSAAAPLAALGALTILFMVAVIRRR
jgi:hypothetical protein